MKCEVNRGVCIPGCMGVAARMSSTVTVPEMKELIDVYCTCPENNKEESPSMRRLRNLETTLIAELETVRAKIAAKAVREAGR